MKKNFFDILITLFIMCLVLGGLSSPNQAATKEKVYVSAWIYQPTGVDTFKKNGTVFDEINPVWYQVTPGNQAISLVPSIATKRKITEIAKKRGVKLVPTIQNNFTGGANVVRKLIGSPESRAKHVRDLVTLVNQADNRLDGIDIDYEYLSADDAPAFSAFIKELSKELRKTDKLLSVCVYPKTKNSAESGQYWPELLKYVDTLKVMVYNYHFVTSKPGPICPTEELYATLEYTRTLPDARKKIVIGLPLYGFDWALDSTERTGRGSPILFCDAERLIRKYKVTERQIRWDCGEHYFTYREPSTGKVHFVYYQDRESLRHRMTLITGYGDSVKGVSFWQLGGEDSKLWKNDVKKLRFFPGLLACDQKNCLF